MSEHKAVIYLLHVLNDYGLWFGRMYQVLLAAGDLESANALVSEIPKDDKDVQDIIKESQIVFSQTTKKKLIVSPNKGGKD